MHNWPLDMHPNAEFFSVGNFNLHKKKGLTQELKRIENGTPSEFSFCWDSLLLFRSHLADFRCIFQIATYCAMSANPNQRWLNCRTPFLMLCTAFAIHTTVVHSRWCWELFGKENIPESEKHSHSWDLREKDYWGYQKQKIVLCIPT